VSAGLLEFVLVDKQAVELRSPGQPGAAVPTCAFLSHEYLSLLSTFFLHGCLAVDSCNASIFSFTGGSAKSRN
jgi:hypothetical protein